MGTSALAVSVARSDPGVSLGDAAGGAIGLMTTHHPPQVRLAAALAFCAWSSLAGALEWAPEASAVSAAAQSLAARLGARSAALAQSEVASSQDAPIFPVNRGFLALGPSGSRGEVDGPFWKANGNYEVLRNDRTGLEVRIHTGYVDGILRLMLDIHQGTWLGFKGTVYDPRRGRTFRLNNWAPIRMDYDPSQDRGRFNWVENGKPKSESFSHGASGREMRIELAGGWDHVFRRKDR